MAQQQLFPLNILVRRVYRFDTHHEMAALVSRIDANESLKEAVRDNFYRLSLQYDQAYYCVIFHALSLAEEHRVAITRSARESGGTEVKDEELRQTLSVYAMKRWLRTPLGEISWDGPLPKPH